MLLSTVAGQQKNYWYSEQELISVPAWQLIGCPICLLARTSQAASSGIKSA